MAQPNREDLDMKLLAATLASFSLLGASPSHANQAQGTPAASPSVTSDIGRVSPALEKYAISTIQEGLWKRPGLTPRDRSIVTVATLIARDQAGEMPRHIALALDNGVRPAEISEIITHLAFYSGWANAMSGVVAAKDVFTQRGIGADQLPAASPQLLPLNEVAEAQRASGVQ
jgi:4-carboxymuconolactone decarboxylase